MNASKYSAPAPVRLWHRRWSGRAITNAPKWVSVGLRDGNQALPNPMTPERKLEYFQMLCEIGFKYIEVGFPAASQEDFDFVRLLIDEGYIPDDVTIVVLTSCQDKLIRRTIKSLRGVKKAIVHSYIASSDLHTRFVFRKNQAEVIKLAVESTWLIRDLAASELSESDINYQFSPEEFTDTDLKFALCLCVEVFHAWGQATRRKPMILNLPATVERRSPNEVADMIEWFGRKFPYRRKVEISVHPHNDQGMAIASAYFSLMAGADRVEGVLFGHGERTGNLAIEVLALDLYVRGIDIGLDFSDIVAIKEKVENLTGMAIALRHPYAGEYAFTAFSGTHQDAINKGLQRIAEIVKFFGSWKMPYILIDPADLGRKFESLIRINGQSGKGGVTHVLGRDYGIDIPEAFRPVLMARIQPHLDQAHREVRGSELYRWFVQEFVEPPGPYCLKGYWIKDDEKDPGVTHGRVEIVIDGQEYTVEADGNGPIDAFANALDELGVNGFTVTHEYDERSMGQDQEATGIAYMPLTFDGDNAVWWGVGTHNKTHVASAFGIVAAMNRRASALAEQ